MHTVHTVRYGHLYYGDPIRGSTSTRTTSPTTATLLAITIGMTFQVSDTDLQAKPIRRNAIRHALLSYAFGAIGDH